MGTAIKALANLTLGSSQAVVSFTSISGSYRDLMLVISSSSAGATNYPGLQLNGDTATNYAYVRIDGDGSSTSAGSTSGDARINWGTSGFTTGNAVIHFLDYSTTDKHKTVLIRANAERLEQITGRWISSSAINRIDLNSNNSWQTGTTFALYGVSA